MSPDSHSEAQSIDRRAVLRRGAAVGALVWTAPVVQSMTWSAAAGERHGTVGSARPCVVQFKIYYCKTYTTTAFHGGKSGKYVTQKWFQVTLPIDVSGECCDLINRLVAEYQSSPRTEWWCLLLVGKLWLSQCFDWSDWKCELMPDKPGGYW
jgi:hypothetical protein